MINLRSIPGGWQPLKKYNGGQFYKEILKFDYFQNFEKIRIRKEIKHLILKLNKYFLEPTDKYYLGKVKICV